MNKPATMEAPAYVASQTEAQFQRAVMDLASLHGWRCYHLPNALYNPTLPDLICFRGEEYRLIELKSERGKVSKGQAAMIEGLSRYGVTVEVHRPSTWDALEASLRGEG